MKSKCIIDKFENRYWYNEQNQLHREDGPALEYADGHKEWWYNGVIHREDGPAVELDNGNKAWYYYGEFIIVFSQKEFERWLRLKMFW